MVKFILPLTLFLFFACSSQEGKFENIEPFNDKSFIDILKWRLETTKEVWPEWVEADQYIPAQKRVSGEKLSYSVINHATVLIQWENLNILTDPIYSNRASPLSWIGPERVRKPGIAFENLPPIDVILISHNHCDHLDLETLKKLKERDNPLILVGLKNGELLKEEGLSHFVELDWWKSHKIGGLEMTFVPVQHWSARGIFDKRDTLWGGFYLMNSRGKKVFFAGDSGYGKVFSMMKEKLGSPDLAFIPIGAYEPRWFMKDQHLNPKEAIKVHEEMGSAYSVGIHFETFQLTDESFEAPRKTLLKIWNEKERKGQFLVPTFGKTISLEPF